MNYNTTLGLPYIRVSNVEIEYGTDDANLIIVKGIEKEAGILGNGQTFVKEGDIGNFARIFSKTDLATGSFNLINIATGEDTNNTMSNYDLFIAFTSFIRKIQKGN